MLIWRNLLKKGKSRLFVSLVVIATGAANGSPILQVDEDGVLMGVSGLSAPDYPWYDQEDPGLLYDVAFKPGRFEDVFDLSPDEYDHSDSYYPWRSTQELMLTDFFSPGGAGHAYTVDNDLKINGCDTPWCVMWSFYQYPAPAQSPFAVVAIRVMPDESDQSNWVDTMFPEWSWEDKGGSSTWAVWSPSQAVNVPEPSTLLLLLSALPLLVFGRRRWHWGQPTVSA